MKPRTSLFLLIASLLYPLGLGINTQAIISLQMYIIFASFYIFLVGWLAVELEKELEVRKASMIVDSSLTFEEAHKKAVEEVRKE